MIRRSLILLVSFVLSLACTDDNQELPSVSDTPDTIILDEGINATQLLPSEGGCIEISFTASDKWTVSIIDGSPDTWCSATPYSGAAGAGSFTLSVEKNTSYENRAASVVISAGTAKMAIQLEQMKKDAIVVAKDKYEFGTEGGCLDFEIQTNTDITVTIPEDCSHWITQVETRALETKNLYFDIAPYNQSDDRTGSIIISGGNAVQTIKVDQSGMALQLEREFLMQLYEATEGDNWKNNTNWFSERPLDEWYGLSCDDNGRLTSIELNGNGLTGVIPEGIGNLANLRNLHLNSNEITGQLPAGLGDLKNLKSIRLMNNQLGGEIPDNLRNAEWFTDFWVSIVQSNKFDSSILPIPGPEFSDVHTIDRETISDDVYAENALTCLFFSDDYESSPTLEFMYVLKKFEAQYKIDDIEVIFYSNDPLIGDFIKNNGVDWDAFDLPANRQAFLFRTPTSAVTIVDNAGVVVYSTIFDDSASSMEAFVLDYFGVEPDGSTDFSSDGQVKIIQKASEGAGIDVVLIGDAFTDKDITDGTYDRVMSMACEKFFLEEPYKSFKDCFNVYSVNAVSRHGSYGLGMETAFSCKINDTAPTCNTSKVAIYAQKAVSESQLENTVVIVVMNTTERQGSCYLYFSDSNDWGSGLSIALVSIGSGEDMLAQIVSHEANGHGFAKLADEYSYLGYGKMPVEEQLEHQERQKSGWWKNIDFTDDPSAVRWAGFLQDTRYRNEGLGVFEGGAYYTGSVWRATERSIMRDLSNGFNAPSREAIYYRIHKLAYGQEWKYDYEEFVEWDARNRQTQAQTNSKSYVPDLDLDMEYYHHPPIVVFTYDTCRID